MLFLYLILKKPPVEVDWTVGLNKTNATGLLMSTKWTQLIFFFEFQSPLTFFHPKRKSKAWGKQSTPARKHLEMVKGMFDQAFVSTSARLCAGLKFASSGKTKWALMFCHFLHVIFWCVLESCWREWDKVEAAQFVSVWSERLQHRPWGGGQYLEPEYWETLLSLDCWGKKRARRVSRLLIRTSRDFWRTC